MADSAIKVAGALIVVLVTMLLVGGVFSIFNENLGETDQKQRASDSARCTVDKALQSGNPESCEAPVQEEQQTDDQSPYEEAVPEE